MKILIVTETYLPFIAGVSTSTDSIARYMESRGDNIIVASPKPVLKDTNLESDRFHMFYTPSIPDLFCKGKPFSPFPFSIPGFLSIVKIFKPDLIHIQEPGAVGWSAMLAARKNKVPVVGAWHFTPDQTLRFMHIPPLKIFIDIIESFVKLFYNRCNGIMVPTQTFADHMKNIGIKPPIKVVSNGVYTDKYFPDKPQNNIREKFDIFKDKILFFFLGRVDEDKHIDEILSALPMVDNSVHLIIAGNGNAKEKLQQLAIKLNVNDKITWLGFMTESEMIDAYRSVDCFVLMSPYEVQSIVTLQALACALPVLLVKAGALPELCHDGENGYLIDRNDAEGLANAMNKIAGDARLRQKMGQESRKISLVHEKSRALASLREFYLLTIDHYKK